MTQLPVDVIWNNLSFFLVGQYPNGPIGGLAMTLFLTVTASSIASMIGFTLGGAQALGSRVIRWTIFVYIQIIRGVPFLTFVFWVFFFLPTVAGYRASGVECAIIALTIYNAAFITEVVRGGITSIPRGQYEAASSLGLTPWRAFRLVIIPQAVRKLYPPLINRFVNLLLGTSMVYVVGVNELTRMAVIVNSRELQHPAEIFGFVGLLYFAICFPLSVYLERLHRRAVSTGF
jgi:polar amino acid transport system permease protein